MFWLAFSRAPKNAQNGTEWQQAILLPREWKSHQREALENATKQLKDQKGTRYPSGTTRDSGPSFLRLRIWAKKIVVEGLWYRFLDFCVGCSKSIKPHEPKVPWPGWSLFIRMFSLEIGLQGHPRNLAGQPFGLHYGGARNAGWLNPQLWNQGVRGWRILRTHIFL